MINDEENKIAIISAGAILPQAFSIDEFHRLLEKGDSIISPIPDSRWETDELYHPNPKEEDCSYSKWAAYVDTDRLKQRCRDLKVDVDSTNRAEVMALDSFKQCWDNIKKKKDKKFSLFVGMMNPDEEFFKQQFLVRKDEFFNKVKNLKELDDYGLSKINEIWDEDYSDNIARLSSLLPYNLVQKIKNHFHIDGPSALIDAACASSLASLDLSIELLKKKSVDIAFCGGVESNLSTGAFVLFSKVSALAPKQCYPYDRSSEGLSQGEGAVIFALKRLEDAIKDGENILGLVNSTASTSDGKSNSLFSPAFHSQIKMYEKVYRSEEEKNIDYLEGHGTGTPTGDQTEIKSLSTFFQNYRIPLGSVKSILGHTKATAGAVGILKALYVINKRVVPPSPYFNKFPIENNGSIFVNTEKYEIKHQEKIRVGVNSLGFGGTNFHALVEEWKGGDSIKEAKTNEKESSLEEVFLSPVSSLTLDTFNKKDILNYTRIPPNSLDSIDKTQIAALWLVHKLFKDNGINWHIIPKNKVSVISSSSLGLDQLIYLGQRILTKAYFHKLQKRNQNQRFNDAFKGLIDSYPKINEDSGPGILNNVIAGRICNNFDFQGKNFHVDCGSNSTQSALYFAKNECQKNKSIVIMININEKFDLETMKVERVSIQASLLIDEKLARTYQIPLNQKVSKVRYAQ
jgi:hypothetical protein